MIQTQATEPFAARPRRLTVNNPDPDPWQDWPMDVQDRIPSYAPHNDPISPTPSAPPIDAHDTFPVDLRNHSNSFPILSPAPSRLARLNLRGQVFWHKLWTPGSNGKTSPTFIKTYEARPKQPVNVYIPPSDVCPPGALPLYIHVTPTDFLGANRGEEVQSAERFCVRLARTHGICVASVGFRRPPRWMFPTHIYDVVAIVQEILSGTSLPIDRRRLAIGGFGMGGTVALGVAQSKEMSGIFRGVMAVCPVVDWTIPVEDKMGSVERMKIASPIGDERKQEKKNEEQRQAQRTVRLYKLNSYAYVPPHQELSDPLLSPAYAARGSLPRHVTIVGAEHDILCAEAEKMALRLAADERGESVGDDDTWNKGGIKWEKVRGWGHEFAFRSEKGVRETERQQTLDDLFDRTADWLWVKVFS